MRRGGARGGGGAAGARRRGARGAAARARARRGGRRGAEAATRRARAAPTTRGRILAALPPRVRDRALPVGLAVLAFVIAILQRPGKASSDTKIDLHVDPGNFLADVGERVVVDRGSRARAGRAVRRLSVSDGAVLRGGCTRVGASAWLAQRLWFGLILALAAWGAVQADGRVRRPAARRRARGRGPAVPAEPVRGRVQRPHDGHAARLRGAALAARRGQARDPAATRRGGRRRSR